MLLLLRLRWLDIVSANLYCLVLPSTHLSKFLTFVAVGNVRSVTLGTVLDGYVVITNGVECSERSCQLGLLLLFSRLRVEKMGGDVPSALSSHLLVGLLEVECRGFSTAFVTRSQLPLDGLGACVGPCRLLAWRCLGCLLYVSISMLLALAIVCALRRPSSHFDREHPYPFAV